MPIDEQHPKQGQSPYAASKISADYLAESFFYSYDLPVVIARPFNTFGPRQSARAIIPSIISQLMSGENQVSVGDIRPTRDFVYVEDTCDGLISVLQTDALIGKHCNICTGVEISIEDLCKELIKRLNPDATLIVKKERLRPEKSEVTRLLGSMR